MDEADKLLWRSYERYLRVRNRAAKTIQSYEETVRLLTIFTDDQPLTELTRDDVDAFTLDQLERHKVSTAALRFRNLRAFYNWLVTEELIEVSPFKGKVAPTTPVEPVPVLSDADVKALLAAVDGKDFLARRDTAMIRLFLDTGVRIAEMAGLTMETVDLATYDVIHVLGKGSKARAVPFNNKAGTALDRYLVQRGKHRHAELPNLWLGEKGSTTVSGIAQMLERRSEEAGIGKVHAHQFRHTFAHNWSAEGGSEQDLMRMTGWTSRAMLARYGASAATERAHKAARKLAIGDRY